MMPLEWILDIAATSAWLALFCALAAGAMFCPLLALFCRFLDSLSGKVFFNHMARQISSFGLLAALLSALPGLAFFISALSRHGFFSSTENARISADAAQGSWINIGGFSFEMYGLEFSALTASAALLLFLFLQFVICSTWKKFRKSAFQLCLCLLGAAAGLCAGWLAFIATKIFPELLPFGQTRIFFIFHPVLKAPFAEIAAQNPQAGYSFLAAMLAAMLALAAALCLCWLLLRRNSDRFGRDYYNFAVSGMAGTASFFGLLTLLASAALLWFQFRTYPAGAAYDWRLPAALLGMLFICCLVWIVTAKSAIPLRHKPGIWLSLLIFAFSTGLLWCIIAIILNAE